MQLGTVIWMDDESGEYIAEDAYYIPVGGGDAPSIGQEPSLLDKLFSVGQRTAELWLSYDARKDMQDLNLERAKKGLAPIDAARYMQMTAPQVQVGVARDTQQLLIYGAVGVGALYLISQLAKR